MPELPEVETVRGQLDEKLAGATIASVDVLLSGREFPKGKKFVNGVVGRKIDGIERRAKLLIWKFSDGNAMTAHLKMTGRFVFVDHDYVPQKHDRMVFKIGDRRLVWSDIRQFGFLRLFSNSRELETVLSAYGPEPLESSVDELAERLKTASKRSVKAGLLDQTVIAGIGNIYADESLHRAGIRPTRRLSSLTADDRLRLAREIKTVLSESLARHGTSSNDYVDTSGAKGGFFELLRVYGREGEPCTKCETPIKRIVLTQRGTHYCPECQS